MFFVQYLSILYFDIVDKTGLGIVLRYLKTANRLGGCNILIFHRTSANEARLNC
jgi:hypothetical protein